MPVHENEERDADGDVLVKVKRVDLATAVYDLEAAGKVGHALYRLRAAVRTSEGPTVSVVSPTPACFWRYPGCEDDACTEHSPR